MKRAPTNLVKLHSLRPRPKVGDYFVVKLKKCPYVWGRVAGLDLTLRGHWYPVLCALTTTQIHYSALSVVQNRHDERLVLRKRGGDRATMVQSNEPITEGFPAVPVGPRLLPAVVPLTLSTT